MTVIAPESVSDDSDGGCAPASKPMNGAKKTNAIAKIGNAIVVAGGLVFAVIVFSNSAGS